MNRAVSCEFLFPFDGRRRLVGDIVQKRTNAPHFQDRLYNALDDRPGKTRGTARSCRRATRQA